MTDSPTERTAYSCTVTNWALAIFAVLIGVAVIVVFFALPHHPVGALVGGLAVALAGVEFSTVRLTPGPAGVVVSYGGFGLPRFRYARDQITDASAEDMSFSQLGGLGLHWSPWRGTRMTVRSGPTLRLALADGGTVAISAIDPAVAAAILNRATSR